MNGVFMKHILDLDSWISKSEWIQGQKILRGKDMSIQKAMDIFSFFSVFEKQSHKINVKAWAIALSLALTDWRKLCLKCNISQFSVTLFDLLHRLKFKNRLFMARHGLLF